MHPRRLTTHPRRLTTHPCRRSDPLLAPLCLGRARRPVTTVISLLTSSQASNFDVTSSPWSGTLGPSCLQPVSVSPLSIPVAGFKTRYVRFERRLRANRHFGWQGAEI